MIDSEQQEQCGRNLLNRLWARTCIEGFESLPPPPLVFGLVRLIDRAGNWGQKFGAAQAIVDDSSRPPRRRSTGLPQRAA
jgi:hypothetical protein